MGGNTSAVFGTVLVAGILTPGTFNGENITLLKYFDGSVFSTNTQNGQPGAVNWLDGGGVVTLQSGVFANSNSTNQ